MRYLLILAILIVLANCRLKQFTVNNNCQEEYLTKLKAISALIENSHYGTYSVNYDNIKVPDGYDTLKWKTEIEVLTNLDKIHTQNMILRSKLNELVVEEASCKLSKSDFIKIIGEATIEDVKNSLTYWFNNSSYPNCYNGSKFIGNEYQDCSLLKFNFDSENKLKTISTIFFYP